MRKHELTADLGAMALSCACAAHCAMLPIMLTSLPIGGVLSLDDPAFHALLLLAALPLSAFGLWRGWRAHRDARVLGVGALCLALLLVAGVAGHERLGETTERVLGAAAGIGLAAAHLCNLRCCAANGRAPLDGHPAAPDGPARRPTLRRRAPRNSAGAGQRP